MSDTVNVLVSNLLSALVNVVWIALEVSLQSRRVNSSDSQFVVLNIGKVSSSKLSLNNLKVNLPVLGSS